MELDTLEFEMKVIIDAASMDFPLVDCIIQNVRHTHMQVHEKDSPTHKLSQIQSQSGNYNYQQLLFIIFALNKNEIAAECARARATHKLIPIDQRSTNIII